MLKSGDSNFTEFILNDKLPFKGKKYEYLKNETSEFILTPLKIMALLIAVSGLFAMIFEVRYFSRYSFHVYFTRLGATLIAFSILVALFNNKGTDKPVLLVHILLLVIIISSGYMIYLLPTTLVVNAQIVGLMIFTSALFLSWDVKNQIIVAIYYNLVFASAVLFNDKVIYFLPNMFESVLFVLFLSIVSVVGSAVNYRLRARLADKNYSLELSEKKFRAIFTNSAEGIFQSSLEGKFLTVNPALVKIFGYSSEAELKKVDIKKDIYKDERERENLIRELKEHGSVINYRMNFKRKDGSDVVVLLNDMIINDDESNTVYFEGTLKDITDQVLAEEKRLKAEEELRSEKAKSDILAKEAMESSLVKSQFLANMSHEIRTPMNGILGFLTLIEKGAYKSNDELRNFVTSTKNSAESLLDIINDILDLSKIESGKMELQENNFNLSEVLDEALEIISPKAEEKNLEIKKIINEDMPLLLTGDSIRLRQILLNLLSNAVKFTERGEIIITAKLVEIQDEFVNMMISVKDSGIGIPESKLSSLFKPFSQVDGSYTRKYGGTGLGLVICKEFVNMMGGEINVESRENEGSQFYFNVKMKLQKIQYITSSGRYSRIIKLEETEQSFQQKQELKESRGRYKILLTEDNVINKKVALRILSEAGYSVDTACNGFEAIKNVKENKYDLILMDVQMPEMDGFTATREIRKLQGDVSKVPIIAITAHALAGDKEKCIEAGMNDYISKPIIADQMIRVIDSLIKIIPAHADSAAEQSDQSKSFFDFNHLEKVSAGDKVFQKELAFTFFEDINQRFDKLASFIFKKNIEKVINEAHTIKGASFSIGAVQVGNEAKKIEELGKMNKLNVAADKLKDLKDALIETERILNRKLI